MRTIKEMLEKLFEKTNTMLEDKMNKIEASINKYKKMILILCEMILKMTSITNITKVNTETELSKINRVLNLIVVSTS